MQCCLFLSVSQWHGLPTNYSTNSKSVNVNLVQSLEINLPHTLRCNLQFTIIVFKTLAIVYIRTSLQSTLLLTTWLSYPYTMTHRLLILMSLTCSLTQIFTFERWTEGFWARDWLLQVIHGVLLFVIVLRNAFTVLQKSRMIREMYRSNWEKL